MYDLFKDMYVFKATFVERWEKLFIYAVQLAKNNDYYYANVLWCDRQLGAK